MALGICHPQKKTKTELSGVDSIYEYTIVQKYTYILHINLYEYVCEHKHESERMHMPALPTCRATMAYKTQYIYIYIYIYT